MSLNRLKALLLLLALALPLTARANLYVFETSLNAAQEVQSPPVVSPAVGSAILTFDDLTNTFDLTLAGVGLTSPIVGAHFHQAAAGQNGSVVKSLGVPGSFAQDNGFAFNALYTNASAEGLQLDQLLLGNIYLNVHTQQYPGGEIRGQVAELVPIPEPATWVLVACGLFVLAGSALRRRQAV